MPAVQSLGVLLPPYTAPRVFGAVGDGVTDDTAAFAAAIATGITVIGMPGDTYLVNGGTVGNTAGQVIDFTGCTIRLKNAASNHCILQLNGAGSKVMGGEWDLNAANNASGDPYGHQAVLLSADYAIAEDLYVHDSFGIGIRGTGDFSWREVRRCRVEDFQAQGIFFDGPVAANTYGTKVTGCKITIDNVAGIVGIYIAGTSPYTYQANKFAVTDNEVYGPAATSTVVGIVTRAIEGIVSGNQVYNCYIGISSDLQMSQGSVFSGNVVDDTQGGYGCIEVNGGNCTVANNICTGSTQGIVGSTNLGTGAALDYNVYSGNTCRGQTSHAIAISPQSGDTARNLSFVGNTLDTTTAPTGGMVLLSGDCQYTSFVGNRLNGTGSGSGYGIYLNSVPGNVVVARNGFANLNRPMVAYFATSVAVANLCFSGNDVSIGIGASDRSWILLQGSATYGTGCQAMGNFLGNSNSSYVLDVLDFAGDIASYLDNTYSYPNGNVTAGAGSLTRRTDGGMWIKAAGTGNTGWKSLPYTPRNVPTYGTTVSITTLQLPGQFDVVVTNGTAFTIQNPPDSNTCAEITIRVINSSGGSMGAITWDTLYKLATWTNPANGYSRAIKFQFDGVHWIESSRTPIDVPN